VTDPGSPEVDTGPEPPLLTDGGLLGLLVLDAVLLALAGLAYAPLYVGGLPAPVAPLATILLLPWLARRAAEIADRPGWSAAPVAAWALTIGVLGLVGPGGDVLLPTTWPTLLLLFGGLAAGLWALARP
jgi:hypothetical protein